MLHLKIFSPKANFLAFTEAYGTIARHRALVFEMTRREIVERYAGQILGAGWSLLSPLLTMAVYVLVFAFVFRGRLSEQDTGGAGYISYVLAGLVPWMAFQDAVSRSVGVVLAHSNLVKQIVFPTEILPLKVALASLPGLAVGLTVVVIAGAISGYLRPIYFIGLMPIAIISFVMMIAGIAYILAAFGVFLKDLRELISFLLAIGMFLHPILYAPEFAPQWLRPVFAFSPITHMVWCFRGALFGPLDWHPWSWLWFPLFSLLVFMVGWRTFRMLKPTFGNAL
ncbi:MAG: ABC transporter permease [Gammaproteobacteria bacterium]|nr:ABC transporter permease [Gammaproteobacteria bacterium]